MRGSTSPRARPDDLPHPFRPQPDRFPAHRRRPHRAVLLPGGAPPRRPVHPARRGHRPRAQHPGRDRRDPDGDGLAGPGVRRRPDLPDPAPGPLPRGGREDGRRRQGLLRLRNPRRARRHARRRHGRQGEAALQRLLPRPQRAVPRRPEPRHPLQEPDRRQRGVRRQDQGPHRVEQRRTRRPGDLPSRRLPHLQLRRGGRRPRHGHHRRDPRRRPRQQHAAPDQHLRGAGRAGAALRAHADDPRPRGRQAQQALTARPT